MEESKKRSRKRRSRYADWGFLERELREIIDRELRDEEGRVVKDTGEFPMIRELRKTGCGGLVNAIRRHHGGVRVVRRAMGFEVNRRPNGYWRDFKNVERELREIIGEELLGEDGRVTKQRGEFPTGKDLNVSGKGRLVSAVRKNHGGLRSVQRRMGFELRPRHAGYWHDFENVEREFGEIIGEEIRGEDGGVIKERGEFPTEKALEVSGKGRLVHAVVRHHGGMLAVRKRMGFELHRRPRGYWRDFKNVERELREIIREEVRGKDGRIMKQRGEFPIRRHLKAVGKRSSLENAVSTYHGGMIAARRRMGFEVNKHPKGYWRDFENVERELREIIGEQLRGEDGRVVKERGEFPRLEDLKVSGKGGLVGGVSTYHGGILAVRRQMGFKLSARPGGYWRDFKNVERELREIIGEELLGKDGRVIKERGEFPTWLHLQAVGKSSLAVATNYHGGILAVRRRMGFELSARPGGYWRDFENVERELRAIMKIEHRDKAGKLLRVRGMFPGPRELKETGHSGLSSGIGRHHGGMVAVRTRMGIGPTKAAREPWKHFENVESELIEIIREEYGDELGNTFKAAGEFPTYSDLQRINRRDLLRVMQVYHGGYRAVKAKMGFSPDMPEKTVEAFVGKLQSVEGAEELARCPDLSPADKADILVVQNRDVFLSPAYVEYALRKMEEMPSFAPYVEMEPWEREPYQTHERLDVLMQRHPDLFARQELFALLVRKLENVYFHRFQEKPQETLAELKKQKQDGVLAEVYATVDEHLRQMQVLRVSGAVQQIKNPHWFEGSGRERTVPFPSLHQKRGILGIVEQKRVLIADEMGTGKTAQAILGKLLLQERSGRQIRTLVVCPSSVISWWREKIDEYCENISAKDVVILSSGGWKRGAMERARAGPEFVLINYDLLSRRRGAGRPSLVGELVNLGFDYVVVDEVHNAKNMNANRADAIQQITERVPYVALLSGTPIPNRLRDIGMTMSLLEPEQYPTAKHFRVAYGNNPRLIRDALINGRMLRVRSEDVFELPELRYREETVWLEPEQRDGYLDIYRDRSLSTYGKFALLRLILLDPNVVPRYVRGLPIPSPKYEALDRILEDKVGAGEKVVVFTCFKRGITGKLAERYERFDACLIDGDTDPHPRVHQESQREVIRREFQFGHSKVLIATVGTMSEGVDLSSASSVVFLDKPFTSTGRDQAVKRVHRLGQTQPVEVVSLVARDPTIDEEIRDKETGDHGTIDEAIERLLEKKEELIEHVVDGARLSEEEKRLLQREENLGRVLYRPAD